MAERIALYPGSFDPITVGHLHLIERAARLVDRLVVVVGYNPNKRGFLPVAERVARVRAATAHLPNVALDTFANELLVDYARRVGVRLVVRGLRRRADFVSEHQQAQMNRHMLPGLETLFLFSEAADLHISSSLVRERLRAGLPVVGLLPNQGDALP